MIVRLPILALLVLALAGATAQARPMTEALAVEKDLMALRDAMHEAMRAKDAIRLSTMFADGFSHIDESGAIEDRDAHVTRLLIGRAMIEDAGIGEWRLRLFAGGTVAVLTGRSPLSVSADGPAYEVRWTQVFVREAGVWRIAASQVTRLP
ncbi:MAG: nuclear transport factor 2 family protein [Alphaproteobacteria bacterium]|nr:nuclear transport factor 2 family protein [Alphaproteobacteria bacterium]MCW5743961.1 nuclear transport factor 2 family protein [Alphaproteobacteria bacterium]